MKTLLKTLLERYFHLLAFLSALIYYLFFAKSPMPQFWDKVFVIIIGAIIISIFVLTSTVRKPGTQKQKSSILRLAFEAIAMNVCVAAAHYFVLLIFFDKNPPISVGIPYSIFSFTLYNVLFVGLLYNFIFYFGVLIYLDYLRKNI